MTGTAQFESMSAATAKVATANAMRNSRPTVWNRFIVVLVSVRPPSTFGGRCARSLLSGTSAKTRVDDPTHRPTGEKPPPHLARASSRCDLRIAPHGKKSSHRPRGPSYPRDHTPHLELENCKRAPRPGRRMHPPGDAPGEHSRPGGGWGSRILAGSADQRAVLRHSLSNTVAGGGHDVPDSIPRIAGRRVRPAPMFPEGGEEPKQAFSIRRFPAGTPRRGVRRRGRTRSPRRGARTAGRASPRSRDDAASSSE